MVEEVEENKLIDDLEEDDEKMAKAISNDNSLMALIDYNVLVVRMCFPNLYSQWKSKGSCSLTKMTT